MNSDQCINRIVHQDKVDVAKSSDLSDAEVVRVSQLFKAFSDPGRLRILHALFLQEMCVCEDRHDLQCELAVQLSRTEQWSGGHFLDPHLTS
jgi:hypothetical protein